jgi:hypothetical protein
MDLLEQAFLVWHNNHPEFQGWTNKFSGNVIDVPGWGTDELAVTIQDRRVEIRGRRPRGEGGDDSEGLQISWRIPKEWDPATLRVSHRNGQLVFTGDPGPGSTTRQLKIDR